MNRHSSPPPVVEIASNIVVRNVNDELVAVDLDSGDYHVFNPVGTRIIQGLASGEGQDTIVEAIVAAFKVTKKDASGDYDRFVSDLLERGLLTATQP